MAASCWMPAVNKFILQPATRNAQPINPERGTLNLLTYHSKHITLGHRIAATEVEAFNCAACR